MQWEHPPLRPLPKMHYTSLPHSVCITTDSDHNENANNGTSVETGSTDVATDVNKHSTSMCTFFSLSPPCNVGRPIIFCSIFMM